MRCISLWGKFGKENNEFGTLNFYPLRPKMSKQTNKTPELFIALKETFTPGVFRLRFRQPDHKPPLPEADLSVQHQGPLCCVVN